MGKNRFLQLRPRTEKLILVAYSYIADMTDGTNTALGRPNMKAEPFGLASYNAIVRLFMGVSMDDDWVWVWATMGMGVGVGDCGCHVGIGDWV